MYKPSVLLCFLLYALVLLVPKFGLWYVAVHRGRCAPASTEVAVDEQYCATIPVEMCCGNVSSVCAFEPGLYHSSDFEVHRNWLSIVSERSFAWLRPQVPRDAAALQTVSVPTVDNLTLFQSLRYWYREDTSLWTLDYPPLFAWYELAIAWSLISDASPVAPLLQSLFFPQPNHCSAASSINLQALRSAVVTANATNRPVLRPLHQSQGIVAFQRASVLLLSDFPYFIMTLALLAASGRHKGANGGSITLTMVLPLLAACCPAWTMIDNIHFQYNGFIFSVFMMSIFFAFRNQPYAAAACYVVLGFLKHMMAYFALGYVVWGIAVAWNGGNCFTCVPAPIASTNTPTRCAATSAGRRSFCTSVFASLLSFVSVVGVVTLIAIGPFVASEYMFNGEAGQKQSNGQTGDDSSTLIVDLKVATAAALTPMKERLFPFARGLVHAYWAPNAYALYSTVDFALCKSIPILAHRLPASPARRWVLDNIKDAGQRCGKTSVNTKGLVGLDVPYDDKAVNASNARQSLFSTAPTHAFLPSITPGMSHVAVLCCFVGGLLWVVLYCGRSHPCLRTVAWWSSPNALLWGTFWSACSFYLFSWHVHEKAVLNIILPVLVLALRSPREENSRAVHNSLDLCLRLNMVAAATVFPLLFTPLENAIKYALFACLAMIPYVAFRFIGQQQRMQSRWKLWGNVTTVFCMVLVALSLWADRNSSTFAPLMMMSSIGSLIVVGSIAFSLALNQLWFL